MDRAHHLAAAGGHAVLHQQEVEVDALVAQRIALVDADHHRRQALDVFGRGKAGQASGSRARNASMP